MKIEAKECIQSVPIKQLERNGILIPTFGPAQGVVFSCETAFTPSLLKPHQPLSLRLFTLSLSAAHMAFFFTYRSPKDQKQQQAD